MLESKGVGDRFGTLNQIFHQDFNSVTDFETPLLIHNLDHSSTSEWKWAASEHTGHSKRHHFKRQKLAKFRLFQLSTRAATEIFFAVTWLVAKCCDTNFAFSGPRFHASLASESFRSFDFGPLSTWTGGPFADSRLCPWRPVTNMIVDFRIIIRHWDGEPLSRCFPASNNYIYGRDQQIETGWSRDSKM